MPYVIHYYTNTFPSSIKHFGENIFRFITIAVIYRSNIKENRGITLTEDPFSSKSQCYPSYIFECIMILHVIKNNIYWALYFHLLQIDGLPIMTPSLPFFHHLRIVHLRWRWPLLKYFSVWSYVFLHENDLRMNG